MSSNYNESNLVIINSKDRLESSSSTSDFSVNIGNKVQAQSFAIKSISLTNIQYNVNSYNNTFTFREGLSPPDSEVTVPVGQYTTTTLIAAIKLAVEVVITPQTIDFTQSTLTQKITATFSTNSSIKGTGLAVLLGYNADSGYGTTMLAPGVPKLQGTYNYYIQTSADTGSQATLSDQSQMVILTEIPNRESFGNQIIYEPNDFLYGKQRFSHVKQIKEMRFTILDDNMDIVNLQGTQVIIVLKLFGNA